MYSYVGPEDIRLNALRQPTGTAIASQTNLIRWLDASNPGHEPLTFVVDSGSGLVLAPRESEHVAAAGGHAVLSAGEITFDRSGDVLAVTNQSTGYCPRPQSFAAVAEALDRIGVRHPDEFTTAFEFRRCGDCASINLVKDDFYVCTVCGSDLPTRWNLDQGTLADT